ncbi:MAG: hypothetical protein [Bacteriophage sp.]|nr:MAG: hypothetical protein [Bacteriophage sp.]
MNIDFYRTTVKDKKELRKQSNHSIIKLIISSQTRNIEVYKVQLYFYMANSLIDIGILTHIKSSNSLNFKSFQGNYKEDNLPFTINDLDEIDQYFLGLYGVLINNINESTYVIEYKVNSNIFNFRGYYTKDITGSCNLSDAKIFNSIEEANNTCEILNEKDKLFLKDFIIPYIHLQFDVDFRMLALVLSSITFEVKRLVISN